jgi:tetratricopeptide (TPR) repeat protein
MAFRSVIAVLLLSSPPVEDAWRAALAAAERLQGEGHYAEAERTFRSALDEARRLEPDLAPAATTYHNLAGLYQDSGRCDPAIRSYQRSIALWEKVGARGEEYLFRTANHLTGAYLECGLVGAAERHHSVVVAPLLEGRAEDEDLAQALSNLGSIEYHKGRYTEALSHYQKALGIRDRRSRAPSLESGVLLNNLAFALLRTGDVPGAFAHSRRAIAMIESVAGPAHRLLVWALLDGADLLVLARRPEDAEPLFRRALAMAPAAVGEQHPLTAAVLSHYAALLKATHRKKEASALESRAREIRARVPPTRQTVDLRELQVSLRE